MKNANPFCSLMVWNPETKQFKFVIEKQQQVESVGLPERTIDEILNDFPEEAKKKPKQKNQSGKVPSAKKSKAQQKTQAQLRAEAEKKDAAELEQKRKERELEQKRKLEKQKEENELKRLAAIAIRAAKESDGKGWKVVGKKPKPKKTQEDKLASDKATNPFLDRRDNPDLNKGVHSKTQDKPQHLLQKAKEATSLPEDATRHSSACLTQEFDSLVSSVSELQQIGKAENDSVDTESDPLTTLAEKAVEEQQVAQSIVLDTSRGPMSSSTIVVEVEKYSDDSSEPRNNLSSSQEVISEMALVSTPTPLVSSSPTTQVVKKRRRVNNPYRYDVLGVTSSVTDENAQHQSMNPFVPSSQVNAIPTNDSYDPSVFYPPDEPAFYPYQSFLYDWDGLALYLGHNLGNPSLVIQALENTLSEVNNRFYFLSSLYNSGNVYSQQALDEEWRWLGDYHHYLSHTLSTVTSGR